MQNVHFTPPELARLFDVNVSTIKRWVDKGMLPASKTTGGHRRIDKKQLNAFFHKYPSLIPKSYIIKRLMKNTDKILDWKKIYTYLKNNDIENIDKSFEQLYLTNTPLPQILDLVISPILQQIGLDWQNKIITIYEEHQMSFLIRSQLLKYEKYIHSNKNKKNKALIACAPQEHHEIPLQMIDLVLKQNNWESLILGINISYRQLLLATNKEKPELICITNTYRNKKTSNFLIKLAMYCEKNKIFLAYGGQGWTDKIKKDLLCYKYSEYIKTIYDFNKFINNIK